LIEGVSAFDTDSWDQGGFKKHVYFYTNVIKLVLAWYIIPFLRKVSIIRKEGEVERVLASVINQYGKID